MSQPVSKIVFGKNALKSGFSVSGQPKVENGNNPDENHVSSTSSSYVNFICSAGTLYFAFTFSKASSGDLATTQSSCLFVSGTLPLTLTK